LVPRLPRRVPRIDRTAARVRGGGHPGAHARMPRPVSLSRDGRQGTGPEILVQQDLLPGGLHPEDLVATFDGSGGRRGRRVWRPANNVCSGGGFQSSTTLPDSATPRETRTQVFQPSPRRFSAPRSAGRSG
jgi:hypothetical protein